MPAANASQQHLFGMALSMKRANKADVKNPAVKRIAETLSTSKIKDFAATKGLKK